MRSANDAELKASQWEDTKPINSIMMKMRKCPCTNEYIDSFYEAEEGGYVK